MSALCAFSALMISCQDNIEPEDGTGTDGTTEEPVNPPAESTDPAVTTFDPVGGVRVLKSPFPETISVLMQRP